MRGLSGFGISVIGRLLSACVVFAAGAAAASAPLGQVGQPTTQLPKAIPGGFDLPNGWRITPAGKSIADIGDLVLKMVTAPDGRAVIAVNSGYLPHGLSVIDPRTHKIVQQVAIKSTWLGLAWSPDGHTLYVSGGNANGEKKEKPSLAPIYEFAYQNGRLNPESIAVLNETLPMDKVWWSGIARHPTQPLLYAANRGVDANPSSVVVFNTVTRQIVTRVTVGVTPYEVALTKTGSRAFVSNWASHSVSVIDTRTNTVIATIPVGSNPNDMAMSPDGRLFVACSNDNTVYVIDSRKLVVLEKLSTSLYPRAPEGSTPNALQLDPVRRLLYVANADNNDIAVIDIKNAAHSNVVGFIPAGWYPSALALADHGASLYIGSTKGEEGHPDRKGPGSPLASNWYGDETIKTLQTSSVEQLPLAGLRAKLARYTRQVYSNTPYNDDLLERARPSRTPSIVPSEVGAGSPIKHVIYIIKENRTYDQVFGDIAKANGDPALTIFGEKVTPNHHALAEQYVTFDNFYADGDVSEDGHSWSNAAYATDNNEKSWPPNYGGHSSWLAHSDAYIPASGYLWDNAARKGLTYRSYGEYAVRVSTGASMDAAPGIVGLRGHVAEHYKASRARDTENAQTFLSEFDAFEKNFDSADSSKQLPNYVVMTLPEDHTHGTEVGSHTPVAMVASNDQAIGMIVERVSHSRYWPTTAIFILEDDAQDGPDHVDARRTVALAISPYTRRGMVDSTFYTTSSVVRTIELLLGMPPMSQYDAAATPLYASFGTQADLTPYTLLPAQVDLNAMNTAKSYGAAASGRMDFSDNDRAPMHQLNEIIWKSVKGADSPMPPPVHRFRALLDATE
jgi:YVTN family beta-propeller protein